VLTFCQQRPWAGAALSAARCQIRLGGVVAPTRSLRFRAAELDKARVEQDFFFPGATGPTALVLCSAFWMTKWPEPWPQEHTRACNFVASGVAYWIPRTKDGGADAYKRRTFLDRDI